MDGRDDWLPGSEHYGQMEEQRERAEKAEALLAKASTENGAIKEIQDLTGANEELRRQLRDARQTTNAVCKCAAPILAAAGETVQCQVCGKPAFDLGPSIDYDKVDRDAKRFELAKDILIVLLPEHADIFEPGVEYLHKGGRKMSPEEICAIEKEDMGHRTIQAVSWADALLDALEKDQNNER